MKNFFILLSVLVFYSCSGDVSTSSVGEGSAFNTNGFTTEKIEGTDLTYVYKKVGDKISEEGFLKNGNRHGSWITYNVERDYIATESNYENGVLNGPQFIFNTRNQIEEKTNYLYGQLTGLYVEYKNGKPLKEIMYKNGALHGYVKEYTKRGKLFRYSEYSNNELDGIVETYNEDGEVMLKYNYKNGAKISGGIVE